MGKYRKHIITALAGIISGVFIAMGVHNCNRQPIETKVERDTIVQYDTVPHWYPKPVEVTKTKTEYRWLTRVAENVSHGNNSVDSAKNSASLREDYVSYVPNYVTDSVLVEVPIESKHYSSSDYDAWVSGYEPSLDSIKVYQRTQLITEIRTVSKPPNRWELDLVGGIDYNINGKKYTPHVGGELMYKPNRLQVGVQGGVMYDNTVQPFVGGVVKVRIY